MSFPEINSKFFLIVNYEKPLLTAIVSSYVNSKDFYVPTFSYAEVTASVQDFNDKKLADGEIDEHYTSRVRSNAFNIKVHNALKRLNGCEYLLIVGLTENQISYLDFLDDYNSVYIDSVEEVDLILKHIVEKSDYISCKTDEIFDALYIAIENNLMLQIDEESEIVITDDNTKDGLIVVEKVNNSNLPLAISYATAINANLKIVDSIDTDKSVITGLIQKWKEKASEGIENQNAFNDLSALLYPSIEHIDFLKYKYATFFTTGAPYGLILKNQIPISHVNLQLSPDFFLFNNIQLDSFSESPSAVVFSPLEFQDEETDSVVEYLENKNLFVKPLVGENATVFNLDNHIKEYPYSILHICSHGGEIEGSRITETFKDRDGVQHSVVYDEVATFAISPYQDRHPVTVKSFFRTFDGYIWRSKELKAIEYPQYVFSDMTNHLRKKKDKDRSKRVMVGGSCYIKCHVSHSQALFRHLASGHSPFIFNNTCWSWTNISESFLAVGAKGYVGTLWAINNSTAKLSAEFFYEEIFEGTILEAFHKMHQKTVGTKDENIYCFWGLHFSKLKSGVNKEFSRKMVWLKMNRSLQIWKDKLKETTREELIRNINEFIDWNAREQIKDFKNEITEMYLGDKGIK
ncbi:hypothetical protein [Dokdonia sp. Asnod1-B02]|uniref:hypothetical protein n=1 Tax=Dokdonia sp. Asnod1-B02 TaxID=3160573 RepID=UPI00386BA107